MAVNVGLFFGLLCVGLTLAGRDTPPQWPTSYSFKGRLQLPYAELDEPVTVNYDGVNNRSRTDYYGDMTSSILRGDVKPYGVGYLIAPLTTYKVYDKKSCFGANGTSDAPVTIQSMLPDLTGFQHIGDLKMDGASSSVWQLTNVVGSKKNTYTMWINSKTNSPVKYEMMGFDSLLGSHYDRYYVLYSKFVANPKFNDSTFAVPKGLDCGAFPGPGSSEHHIILNPMREYIQHYDQHHVEMFQTFKKTHRPNYKSREEHTTRQNIFRHNVRFIHSKNRAGLTYKLAINHLADRSTDELRKLRGSRYTPRTSGFSLNEKQKATLKDVPDSFDWRLYGAVNPVKDQAVCGSCWSFGTTGTIEGAYFLKHQMLVRFSQQELMDCSWGEGNNGCDGGEDFRSYNWIMKNGGLTSEENYGAYLGQDGHCHSKSVTPVVNITSYVNITSGDQSALQFALLHQGPISVGIDASHKSLSFYANGVYYEPACGNDPDSLDHAVLAVGYGTINGQDYWLIKNSWSTYWGDDGYVLMSKKDNNCGVATAATYVNVA